MGWSPALQAGISAGIVTLVLHQFCRCGREVRYRAENPTTHVRFVTAAPDVTVAEWLRRLPVEQSTRVQFSPVTPTYPPRGRAGRHLAAE